MRMKTKIIDEKLMTTMTMKKVENRDNQQWHVNRTDDVGGGGRNGPSTVSTMAGPSGAFTLLLPFLFINLLFLHSFHFSVAWPDFKQRPMLCLEELYRTGLWFFTHPPSPLITHTSSIQAYIKKNSSGPFRIAHASSTLSTPSTHSTSILGHETMRCRRVHDIGFNGIIQTRRSH